MHAFDRRTDERTDRILIARPRLHCMQRGKNDTTITLERYLSSEVTSLSKLSCLWWKLTPLLVYITAKDIHTDNMVYRVAQKSKLLSQYNSLLFWATLYVHVRASVIDLDECARENGRCPHDCTNTEGSFKCSCHDGFNDVNGDGTKCIGNDMWVEVAAFYVLLDRIRGRFEDER